jgi:gamma-glutamyl:cysteine ligase YbdK (ATP-grasp superfamily)
MIEQITDSLSNIPLNEQQVNEVFTVANDCCWARTFEFVMDSQPDFFDGLGDGSILESLAPFTVIADWEVKYNGDSIGVEKEMLILDENGGVPNRFRTVQIEEHVMAKILRSKYRGSFCYHDGLKHDVTEVCTDVANNLADLSRNLKQLYKWVQETLKPGEDLHSCGYAADRTMATQINLGASSADEACYLMNVFRQHLPEFVALSLNSGRIYQEGVCSEFPEKVDLMFIAQLENYTKKTKSAIPHPIILSPRSTVEIRCCDSQANPNLDVALAAYAFAIHQYARDKYPYYPVARVGLEEMYANTSKLGLEAQIGGVFVKDWINQTLDTVQPDSIYFKPLLSKL